MKGEGLKKGIKIALRNQPVRALNQKEAKSKEIHLEWWSETKNVGDELSVLIYEWMLSSKNLRPAKQDQAHRRLLGLGSVLGMREYDAIVWGSGLHRPKNIQHIQDYKNLIRYEIRAVRGPKTRQVLLEAGYECPEIYGDPAILLPWIIQKPESAPEYKVSFIPHYLQKGKEHIPAGVHVIDVQKCTPLEFIEQITRSEKVISSSLHGLIVAETYGIEALFLARGMEDELFKYEDWYASTLRPQFFCAASLQEALDLPAMPLPDQAYMEKLRKKLYDAFCWQYYESRQ